MGMTVCIWQWIRIVFLYPPACILPPSLVGYFFDTQCGSPWHRVSIFLVFHSRFSLSDFHSSTGYWLEQWFSTLQVWSNDCVELSVGVTIRDYGKLETGQFIEWQLVVFIFHYALWDSLHIHLLVVFQLKSDKATANHETWKRRQSTRHTRKDQGSRRWWWSKSNPRKSWENSW